MVWKPFIINIEEIRRGDKKAFERVYHEFFDVLFYLCIQYLEKEQLAEEVVQDTFMKLWEVRESLPDGTNIKNFLYTITKNNCLNLLRNEKIVLKHQQNLRYLEMKMNYEALDSLGDQVIEYDELQNKIQSAISNLPDDIRKVFIMNRFEDLKYKEIAEQLNISIKTVEARISRALVILRKELKDYLYLIYFISHLLF